MTFAILQEVKKVIQKDYKFNEVDGTSELWSTIVLPNLPNYAGGILKTMINNYGYSPPVATIKDDLPRYLVSM